MDPITGGHDAPASTSTLVTGLAALGTMVCVGIFVLLATVFTAWAEKVGLVDWIDEVINAIDMHEPDNPNPVLEAHLASSALTAIGAVAMARAARQADAARPPAAPPPPPPAEADLEA